MEKETLETNCIFNRKLGWYVTQLWYNLFSSSSSLSPSLSISLFLSHFSQMHFKKSPDSFHLFSQFCIESINKLSSELFDIFLLHFFSFFFPSDEEWIWTLPTWTLQLVKFSLSMISEKSDSFYWCDNLLSKSKWTFESNISIVSTSWWEKKGTKTENTISPHQTLFILLSTFFSKTHSIFITFILYHSHSFCIIITHSVSFLLTLCVWQYALDIEQRRHEEDIRSFSFLVPRHLLSDCRSEEKVSGSILMLGFR